MDLAPKPEARTASSYEVAGIHLSGPNVHKSAVAILNVHVKAIKVSSLYEKIGSSGRLFSDERLLTILSSSKGLRTLVVDCPLTEPPCVSCTRAFCPGVVHCDDVAVAAMMAEEGKRERKGARKLRPYNPQSHRLWDVLFGREFINQADKDLAAFLEPTYSANLAPLVVRAKTLQRRLSSAPALPRLEETSVMLVIQKLGYLLSRADWVKGFRNFEVGSKTREEILRTLKDRETLGYRFLIDERDIRRVSASLELFSAIISGLTAAWHSAGMSRQPGPHYDKSYGWVVLPNL